MLVFLQGQTVQVRVAAHLALYLRPVPLLVVSATLHLSAHSDKGGRRLPVQTDAALKECFRYKQALSGRRLTVVCDPSLQLLQASNYSHQHFPTASFRLLFTVGSHMAAMPSQCRMRGPLYTGPQHARPWRRSVPHAVLSRPPTQQKPQPAAAPRFTEAQAATPRAPAVQQPASQVGRNSCQRALPSPPWHCPTFCSCTGVYLEGLLLCLVQAPVAEAQRAPEAAAATSASQPARFSLYNWLRWAGLPTKTTRTSALPAAAEPELEDSSAALLGDGMAASATEPLLHAVGRSRQGFRALRRGASPPPAPTPAAAGPQIDTSHATLQLIRRRLMERSRPGARTDGFKLGLVVEGGGMRGCVSGGGLQAMHDLGMRDVFDAVYGSSAGAINSTYFLSGQREGVHIYHDHIAHQEVRAAGREGCTFC